MTQYVTRQCQTVLVYLSGTVLSDLRVPGQHSVPSSGTAQSPTQPLQSHPWQSWLWFLSVCSGGRGPGRPQHAAADPCRPLQILADPRPGRDGHRSGQLTAGTAGPEWQLSATCWWHSLPFSRSGGSPEVPDCGLWLSSFALCQQLVAMMALFVILFFRKESELIPKGFCLSYSPRLQIRLELLFRIPLSADYLLIFSLCLSGQVAYLFVFSHFVFLTMISSLSSAKHLQSDSQTIYLELSGTCVNCAGSPRTKVKGSPAHFLRPQFKFTCWHQTSIIYIQDFDQIQINPQHCKV